MRNPILTFLLFVFCSNAFADCPEYEVTLEYTNHLSKSPNQVDICTVSLDYDMGFGHSQFITVVYFDATLLPKNIIDCTQFDDKTKKWTGQFTFDDTQVMNTPEDLARFGIYTIFPSFDQEEVAITLLDNGKSLQILKHLGSNTSQELDVDAFLYSWQESSQSYTFTETKIVKALNSEIEAIKNAIASNDFEALSTQLETFDFGGDYGAPFKKLPKEVTDKLWTNLHKNALALYKKGDRKEAAQRVLYILKNIPVNPPPNSEIEEYYERYARENSYNYAIDALHQNPKLLTAISDCAFFLEQADIGLEWASDIFSYIILENPKRTVTYLNQADALWKQGLYEDAKENYQIYLKDMMARDKKSAIPTYVNARLNE